MMYGVSVTHSASLCSSFLIAFITHKTKTWSIPLPQGCNTVKSNVVVHYGITGCGPFKFLPDTDTYFLRLVAEIFITAQKYIKVHESLNWDEKMYEIYLSATSFSDTL